MTIVTLTLDGGQSVIKTGSFFEARQNRRLRTALALRNDTMHANFQAQTTRPNGW